MAKNDNREVMFGIAMLYKTHHDTWRTRTMLWNSWMLFLQTPAVFTDICVEVPTTIGPIRVNELFVPIGDKDDGRRDDHQNAETAKPAERATNGQDMHVIDVGDLSKNSVKVKPLIIPKLTIRPTRARKRLKTMDLAAARNDQRKRKRRRKKRQRYQ